MNKKTAYKSGILILLVYLLVAPKIISATSFDIYHPVLSDEELRWKVNNLDGEIDFKYTPEVREYIKKYIRPGRSGAEQILGRIPVYFPVFERKIKEKNLPEELKVLAIVESHLKVSAYSKAGAAGLWQLIKGTARQYDLTVKRNYDERYSVEESTDAALDFLKDLYFQFNDWTLALAAYNCGPGNVRKAIRRSGGKTDFWVIKKYLPKETRNYVPKFIATSYLLKHYKEYGINPDVPDKLYFETADARIYRHLSFKEISDITGVSLSLLKNMNYAYRRNYIPANTHGYRLTLPKDALFTLLEYENYNQMEFVKVNNFNYSKYIMNNFSREIAMHLLGGNYRLEINTLVPKSIESLFTRNSYNNRIISLPPLKIIPPKTISNGFVYYKLKAGESLMDIANNYENISLVDILRWNDVSLSNPPRAGTKLRIKNIN